jgi:transmembrane sensor
MNDLIRQKILDYFNGRLPAEEEAGLLSWIKADEENRIEFLRLKESLDPEKMEHPLLRSSYAELKNKLGIGRHFKTVPGSKSKKLYFSFSRVAAMLLLALITGFAVAYFLVGTPPGKSAQVVWFETKVPRGEKSQLLLPDGSKVWLNSESSLSYPSNFMEDNRKVQLKGEAYFEVAKQDGSTFTVGTNDYDVLVHGTSFNVMAYADFDRTETTLIEGKIEIRRGTRTIDVNPGQTLIFREDRFRMERSDAEKSAKWKDDIFDFDQITFQELVVRLERWYDVDIEIKNPDLNQIVYSGVFKNEETIDQVLNTLELTSPIRYSRNGFREFIIE